MECKCGGVVNTSSDVFSSEEAQTKFPNRKIPVGYDKIHFRHGECPECHRYTVSMFPQGNPRASKQGLFRFVKKPV